MSTTLLITATAKAEKYEQLNSQIESLLKDEKDTGAAMATITAAIQQTFELLWVGFYLVKEKPEKEKEKQLVIGPFQGPVACLRIDFGKGVCGKAWKDKKTINVPNVDLFVDHIACSSASRSEIVVPVFNSEKEVVAVLDLDSEWLSEFDEDDINGLEKIVELLKDFNFYS